MGSPALYCLRCGSTVMLGHQHHLPWCTGRRSPSPGTTHDELVLAQWLAGAAGHDADARAEAWTETCDARLHPFPWVLCTLRGRTFAVCGPLEDGTP